MFRKPFWPVIALLLCLVFSPLRGAEPENACPPAGYTREDLLALRQAEFELTDEAERNALALALLSCIADPDPELRDGVAFEGISHWLRSEQLSQETYLALHADLMAQMQAAPDDAGFRQPFAALILSEVARVDRLRAQLDPDLRLQTVKAAASYLGSVKDYRGFSTTEGWRHGVAHGADLALQLVLNEAVSAEQVKTLLAAVATQISPDGETFYVYGEPGRLARVVFYAHQRTIVEPEFWAEWFESIAKASPLNDWSQAFSSQQGLAKRHNTLAFLLAMHLNATAAGDANSQELDLLVLQALSKLP